MGKCPIGNFAEKLIDDTIEPFVPGSISKDMNENYQHGANSGPSPRHGRQAGCFKFVAFLDAPSHLYKRVCPADRRSVGP